MWTKINSATADAVVYNLYAANLDQAKPFVNWYVERVTHSATFIGTGQSTTFASWLTHPNKNSDQAWADRETLTYGANLLPSTYGGDAGLRISAEGAGGGDAVALELPSVSLTKNGWTQVSSQMQAGKTYNLFLREEDWEGWILSASNAPTFGDLDDIRANGSLVGEEHDARLPNGTRVEFDGTPIWLYTTFGRDGEPANLRIQEMS